MEPLFTLNLNRALSSPSPSLTYSQGNLEKVGGRLEVGWGKVECWSPKATISRSETRKRTGKVTMEGLGTLSNSTIPHLLGSYGLVLPKIGGSQPHPPKTPIAIISGMGEATDFKCGRNICRIYPNTSPLKILDKRERGHIHGLPIFGGTPYYLRNR